jgi:hypothetical protein
VPSEASWDSLSKYCTKACFLQNVGYAYKNGRAICCCCTLWSIAARRLLLRLTLKVEQTSR